MQGNFRNLNALKVAAVNIYMGRTSCKLTAELANFAAEAEEEAVKGMKATLKWRKLAVYQDFTENYRF